MTNIQVILVEDDEPTRVAMRTALRSQSGIAVASEATNGETGLVLLESIDVDVAIVDATLPDMNLSEFTRKMREVQAESCVTRSRLLILVDSAEPSELQAIFDAKADAYCLKQASIQQLADAIRVTDSGDTYLDPAIAQLTSKLDDYRSYQASPNRQPLNRNGLK